MEVEDVYTREKILIYCKYKVDSRSLEPTSGKKCLASHTLIDRRRSFIVIVPISNKGMSDSFKYAMFPGYTLCDNSHKVNIRVYVCMCVYVYVYVYVCMSGLTF